MATAPRHPIVESLITLFLQLFWPEWLADPRTRAQPPSGTALPKLPDTPQKLIRALPVRNTDGLPRSVARNGHANDTAPQPSVPNAHSIPTVLGDDIQTGEEGSIPLDLDARFQGVYCIGATGTGKTTLLLNMILADICSDRGLCLIEPHGDLTKSVIAAMPQRRLSDVIYLDITDSASSFGLNFFECPAGADLTEVAKVASFVMHLFEAVWAVGPETPRLAQVLRNTTRVLIENPGMTFSEIPLLLWDDGVREKLVRCATNTQTKLFWSQYNRKQPRDREELIASTINKVDAYLNEPLIARIVSQSASTLDFRRIMDEGRILLVRLSPQLEEPSRLLGAAILGRLLMAAFSRSDMREGTRRPFMIYADEYQRFATADFATFLAEARKSGVATTIAHQTLEQVDDLNRATALQAGTLIVLRVSGDDSKVLARSFDATPTPEAVGEEPVRSVVLDPLAHLVKHSHPHPAVAKFVSEYLLPLETLSRYITSLMGQPLVLGPTLIRHIHVIDAKRFLNETLTTCMQTSRADLTLSPLTLFIVGGAAGTGIPHVFTPDLKNTAFNSGVLNGFLPSANRYGQPGFLANQQAVSALVQTYAKKRVYSHGQKLWQSPGPTFIEFLKVLRQTMEVLAKEPLITDTGLYQPKYQLRTYADQENLVANELSQLSNYTAKVKLLTGEHTIRTNPAPKLLSEPEVHARIRAIQERMLLQGYTTAAQAVDEAVSKRHEALRARPASDAPPPTHTDGRRNGRQKPPGRS